MTDYLQQLGKTTASGHHVDFDDSGNIQIDGNTVIGPSGAGSSAVSTSSNTSSTATASTPTIANTATGVQVSTTTDVMLYLTCSTLGTAFTLKIGPTSTPANTVVNNVSVTVGDCFSVRVPAGWYVSWVATSAAFANQLAVTC